MKICKIKRNSLRNLLLPAAFTAALLATPAQAGAILQPATAISSAGSYSTYDIVHTIDQSGMSATYSSQVTDFDSFVSLTPTSGGSNSYNGWFSPSEVTASNITFNLGGTFDIDAFALWTDFQNAGQGVNSFRLTASQDAGFSSSTLLGDFFATAGTGFPESTNVGQVFNFNTTTASYVLMEIFSNHGASFPVVGFSEAAFRIADSSATPPPGSTPSNPLLPTDDATPEIFDFTFEITVPDEPIFIDPLIAIGYDYIVSSGPNIATVLLPTISSDDGLYNIYLWDGDGFDIFAGAAEDGVAFDFTALAGYEGGVDRFRVLGIDQAALLDPTLDTAFVTGLTFVGSGTVTMSQTPVTFDTDAVNPGPTDVPEPMTLSLLGAGLGGLAWARRRRV